MYIGTIPVSKRHTVGNLSEEQDEESPNSVEETGFNESETLFNWQNVLIFDRNDAFLWCHKISVMTTSEKILNYAALQGGTFHRKGLLHYIMEKYPDVNERTVDLQINRLMSSGVLKRSGRGKYMVTENRLPEFVYLPSAQEQEIFSNLKVKFPFLDMCVWSPRVLASYMLHVPNIAYSFVDVEKDGMETVFHMLQGMRLGRNILFSPSAVDCERYLVGTDSIVVRQLIGQSPLTEINGCSVPRIEKILVDALGDNELFFTSGSEIYNIYEYACERNNVNMSKLLRYASRRNRKDKVEHIINAINDDKS